MSDDDDVVVQDAPVRTDYPTRVAYLDAVVEFLKARLKRFEMKLQLQKGRPERQDG